MYLKKIVSLSLGLILASTGVSVSYADSTETVAGLAFFGPTIDLSLDQALSLSLTSGASIKVAEIQKQSDTATAKANSESYSNMSDANDSATNMFSVTYSTYELYKVKKAKEYYTSMADRNYDAAVNSITYTINDAYYSLMNAEEEVRIATENVRLQNNLLTLVKRNYSLGMASKLDLLDAEISLNGAKSVLSSAEVSLANEKMNLNIELGFDELQDVNLTSELAMLDLPTVPVEEAVTLAVENRNELYTGAFNIYTALQDFNLYKYYPKSSAKYLTAYKNYQAAENEYDRKEAAIKMEVRMDYAKVQSAKSSADNAKISTDKAKESYTIYLEKYKLGMATLDQVQSAQNQYFEAEKSYSEGVLNYNLAVLTYELSTTVGMSSY